MKNFSFVVFASSFASIASAQSGPEVTPYRPGAAAGSSISAAGYFETELSFDTAKGSGVRADVFGALLKYGVSDNLGLILGLPYLRVSGLGVSDKGLGDGLLGFKYVQKLDKEQALGVQLTTSLPTGKSNFRADDPTIALTGIYGLDFSGFHADLNLGVRRNTAGGSGASTLAWVAGISRPIGDGLGWYVEGAGTRVSGENSTTLLGALTYTVSPKLALDASISRARSGGANATGFGVGMTYLFAK